MNKVDLTKIDEEKWRFVLYRTVDEKWIGDFTYSPKSYVDLSILIELTEREKEHARSNRKFLIDLSESIRNNYNEYFKRGLNRDNFVFND